MPEALRIMHVVQSINCGGQEKMIVSLAERQLAAGMLSSICVLEGPGELTAEAEQKKIPLYYLRKRPGLKLGLPFRLSALLKEQRIRVMHAHNMGPALYGIVAARLAGVPASVLTRHSRDPKKWNALLWRMIDAVVAISKDTEEAFRKHNSISPEKLHVICNGVDSPAFTRSPADISRLKAQLGIGVGEMVIGTVGRLCPEKDHIGLLQAYKLVLQSCSQTKLLIVGGGGLQGELEECRLQNRLVENVILTGFRNDVRELLQCMDVFVMSSISEGMSIALLEAMANGIPAVVTAVGGNLEVVEDGRTGFIVPPRDPQALAQKVCALIRDDNLRSRYSEEARRRIAERFSVDQMAAAYLRLYVSILKAKGVV
jgi:glycosyltransferase involved in cell wall biosynthesis